MLGNSEASFIVDDMASNTADGIQKSECPNGTVVQGDFPCDGRIVLYIIKATADQTSYINYIKPLMLAEELQIPYVISCIDTTQDWYYKVHPERYVPALKDVDPDTQEEVYVFEGTACLQHIASRYDIDGTWSGRTVAERAMVFTWTAYQTAGLGPTAKYWLYFSKGYPNRQNPEILPKTTAKLKELVLKQWDILEKRLAEEGQNYVAIAARPTIADLCYLPFAMPWMFSFFGVNVGDWPRVEDWSKRMMERESITRVLKKGPTYGH
ncbi:MAG: hypothetical protein Q9165_008265 [Trypethelium subeluteriae]